jgi:integrase
MQRHPSNARVSGHVVLREGSRGSIYYLKYRLPDGRQVKRRLGPAWPSAGVRPLGTSHGAWPRRPCRPSSWTPAGAHSRGWSRRERPSDASAEWLRYVEHDRDVKPSTLLDYRHMARRLDRDLGEAALEQITTDTIELWRAGLSCANRTTQKYLIVLNGIFKRAMKVYGLPANPMILVERPRVRHSSEIEVFSAAEVRALVRAASTELYGTVFLAAAFTGLRMGELLALRWGEVDFAAETIRVVRGVTVGGESSPKSGKARSVPMVNEVATALARLSQRERFTTDSDLVFAGAAGGHLDSKDLRAAYKAALDRAGLRRLRFHDLRHTFGTRAVEKAESILELKEWMGHANVQTTMRYLHTTSPRPTPPDGSRRPSRRRTPHPES